MSHLGFSKDNQLNDKQLYEKGIELYNYYQPNQSLLYFERLIEEYPDSSYFLKALEKVISIYYYNDSNEKVTSYYYKYEKNIEKNEDNNLKNVEKIIPLVVNSLYRRGEYEETIDFLEYLKKIKSKKYKEEIILACILSSIELNDYSLYNKLIELVNDNHSLFTIGYKFLEKSHENKALSLFQEFMKKTSNSKIEKLEPKTIDMYISLSNIYVELNKVDDIYPYFKEIIDKVPDNYTNIDVVFYAKAYLEMEIGLYKQSLDSFIYHIENYSNSVLVKKSEQYIEEIKKKISNDI